MKNIRKRKNNLIFISGNFNIIHPGHIRLFRYAKEMKGKLVVGVQSDKIAGKASHISEDLRLETVQNNSLVDEAFIIRNSLKA